MNLYRFISITKKWGGNGGLWYDIFKVVVMTASSQNKITSVDQNASKRGYILLKYRDIKSHFNVQKLTCWSHFMIS